MTTVKMKQFEAWCKQYSSMWDKPALWDSFILVQDAYINGFKKAREEGYSTTGDARLLTLGEAPISVLVKGTQIGGSNSNS